jgi:putative ABC transport system substrate-binding protein
MTKTFKLVSFLLLFLVGGAAYFFYHPAHQSASSQEKDVPVIVITQIIAHHTLDTVREGLMAELEDQGYGKDKANIVYENAHGNVSTATQIGNKFAALHPKIMVALSTQSAQVLSSISAHEGIPLVFTAVTDPVAAKLVVSKTEPGKLITGVSDFMSAEPQLEMMRAFLPKLTKLGVLYNPAEINSVSFLEEMEKVAKAQGIEFVRAPLNGTTEATSATTSFPGLPAGGCGWCRKYTGVRARMQPGSPCHVHPSAAGQTPPP